VICMYVFFSFRKAVRAFSLACPAIAVLLQLIMSWRNKRSFIRSFVLGDRNSVHLSHACFVTKQNNILPIF